MTSDRSPLQLKDIEERLLTRFKWGLSAEIQRPNFQLRRDILCYKLHRDGITLSDDIIDFIANNVRDSIPLVYGREVYDLFCQMKAAFDPDNLLNVGKIVHTPRMDEFLRYEANQRYTIQDTNLMRRIERCNGSGDCRKSNLIGGTMCPAFKVSGDELMSTRARANVLRDILTRGDDPLRDPSVLQVLESCLACKACRSECPSNVDMTRIRAQVLQLHYDATHTPFRSWMVARMALVERIGSLTPYIYNWFATNKWTSKLLKNLLHFAVERRIPTLSRHTMR